MITEPATVVTATEGGEATAAPTASQKQRRTKKRSSSKGKRPSTSKQLHSRRVGDACREPARRQCRHGVGEQTRRLKRTEFSHLPAALRPYKYACHFERPRDCFVLISYGAAI